MWPAGLFNASADTSCAALLHLGNKFEKVHRGPAWQQPTVPLTHLGLGHLLLLLDLVWPKIGKNNCAAKIGACNWRFPFVAFWQLNQVKSGTTDCYAASNKKSLERRHFGFFGGCWIEVVLRAGCVEHKER